MSVFANGTARFCQRNKMFRSHPDQIHFQMQDSDMVFVQKLDTIPVKPDQTLTTQHWLKQFITVAFKLYNKYPRQKKFEHV